MRTVWCNESQRLWSREGRRPSVGEPLAVMAVPDCFENVCNGLYRKLRVWWRSICRGLGRFASWLTVGRCGEWGGDEIVRLLKYSRV